MTLGPLVPSLPGLPHVRQRDRHCSGLLWMACWLVPWLYPFARGPSTTVEPWLASAVCAIIAFVVRRPLHWPVALTAAVGSFAAWATLRTGVGPETLALAGAGALILMTAATASASRQSGWIRWLGLAWVLAAAISTAIALIQYFGAGDALAPWVNSSAPGEAYANLRQRNQFASLSVIGMASLLFLRPAIGARWRLAAATMAWLAVGNAATTSRTGLAEMLMLGVLVLAWRGQRARRFALWASGVAAYTAAAFVLPYFLRSIGGVPGFRLWERVAAVDTCSSRATLWSNVFQLIGDKPWLGWGWGELDFAHFVTRYDGARFCDILDNAHSLPLHVAVELGIPAALVLCAGLLWAVVRARPWSEQRSHRQLAWAVLGVLLIHSLLEYPLWYGPFQLVLGLCLGLLWPKENGPASRAKVHSGAGTWLLVACAASACIYAAWDYRRVSQIYLPPEARAAGYEADPLPKIRGSRLFHNQALFAELTTTPLTRDNAAWTFANAERLLHYSPEPRVIEKLLDSALLLARDDDVAVYMIHYRAAFPDAFETWLQSKGYKKTQ